MAEEDEMSEGGGEGKKKYIIFVILLSISSCCILIPSVTVGATVSESLVSIEYSTYPPLPTLKPCPLEGKAGASQNVVVPGLTVTQSSTEKGGALAIDGKYTPANPDEGVCSATKLMKSLPWLRVDLENNYVVEKINLIPLDDPCCVNSYHSLQFRVGSYDEETAGIFTQNGLCEQFLKAPYPQGVAFNATCPRYLVGRYVTIQIATYQCDSCENVLIICELEVIGYPLAD